MQQNRGLRRSRVEEEEDDSEGGLELPHLKKRRTVEVPSESEDEWTPTYPQRLPGGRWPDEGPSDHRAEVWEEIWDDQLEEEFVAGRRSRISLSAFTRRSCNFAAVGPVALCGSV